MNLNRKGFTLTNLLLIILIIIIAASTVVITYVVTSNKEGEVKNKETFNDEKISKLYDTKDWIYDATYEYNVNQDSYYTYYNSYSVKNIIVPYINIDSTSAITANKEIKSVFDEAIASYNKGVENKTTYVDDCSYQSYIDESILSVVLKFGVGGTEVVQPKYYTYNYDLKTGKILTYEDMYKLVGLDKNSVRDKIKQSIIRYINNSLSNQNIDTSLYNDKSIKNYDECVDNNSIEFFLDKNKKLNLVVELSLPAGTGKMNKIFTID